MPTVEAARSPTPGNTSRRANGGGRSATSDCLALTLVAVLVGRQLLFVGLRWFYFEELGARALALERDARGRAGVVVAKMLAATATSDQRCVH